MIIYEAKEYGRLTAKYKLTSFNPRYQNVTLYVLHYKL
jgi:hypothetical protein